MPEPGKTLKTLLSTGKYTQALGFEIDSPKAPDVIVRVMELGDENPDSKPSLIAAQDALTVGQNVYREFRRIADRSIDSIASQHGPFFTTQLLPWMDQSLEAVLWGQLTQEIRWCAPGLDLSICRQREAVAQRWEERVGKLARDLVPLEITYHEFSKAVARRHSVIPGCIRCGGTGIVTLHGREALERAARDPSVGQTLQDKDSSLLDGSYIDVPCQYCVTEIRFAISRNAKVGWVVFDQHGQHVAQIAQIGQDG